MITPPLVLASSSPRRRDILQSLQIPFDVHPADVDETPKKNEGAKAMVLRLAKAKAAIVAQQFPDRWVLAADTTVTQRDIPILKPKNAADARKILTGLQGKKHQVHTAICLQRNKHVYAVVDTTTVYFRSMTPTEVRWYVETGEPLDKAGGYGIQGIAARFIRKIEGSQSNVIGLPIEKTIDLLKKTGLLAAWMKN